MDEGCEVIITKTGWGLCNYFLIGLCGLCTLVEATAVLIILIAIPLITCDFSLSKKQIIILNAVSSLGMTLGGLLFGTIADYSGRKNLISISMVIIFSALLGLSFSQSYFLITFFVFVLGIGTAGSHLIIRVYLVECVPAKKRGISLVIVDLLWSIGYVLSFSLSWTLIPSIIKILSHEFRPNSWRVLVGLGSVPGLIMSYISSLLPPSPRYLLYRRRPQHALMILQQMFAINNSQHVNNFPSCNLNNCVRSDDDDANAKYFLQVLREFTFKAWNKITLIYSKKFIKSTLIFTVVRFLLFPGFIQITQWKAYLSDETNYSSSSNKTCFTDFGDITSYFLNNCHQVNDSHFKLSLIFSSSFILGESFLLIAIDNIGRQLSLIISGLVGGISILVIIFDQDSTTIWSILFLSSFSIVHTTTSIKLLENYPTSVRGTIWGFTSVLPHITLFLITSSAVISCWIVIYVMLGLLIAIFGVYLIFVQRFAIFIASSGTENRDKMLIGIAILISSAIIAVLPIPDLTNAPIKE